MKKRRKHYLSIIKNNFFLIYIIFLKKKTRLLVFISISKFVLIGCSKKTLNKVVYSQNIVLACIVLLNIIFYSPILELVKLRPLSFNLTASQLDSSFLASDHEDDDVICEFDSSVRWIIDLMDLINYAILPFALMLIFSLLMIITIFKSRLKILRLTNSHDRNRLKKDIKFAITSIILNFFFIILNLPLCIQNFVQFENFYIEEINLCFYLSNFCINFYVLIFSNSIIRSEAFNLFS